MVCSRKKRKRGKVFNEGTQYRKKKKGEKLGYLWSLSKKRKGINVGGKKSQIYGSIFNDIGWPPSSNNWGDFSVKNYEISQ